MSTSPHRVALTGGIATGKSYVAEQLRKSSVRVVDADLLARYAVRPGSAALEAVRQRFGDMVIGPDGGMNRKWVGDLVFRDEQARRDLERIIHPIVRLGIEDFFASLPGGVTFAVADIPLLYETGRSTDFEAVIVAACPREMQIARIIARDGANADEAERRVRSQWPIDEKVARADYVIRTDRSHAETNDEVKALVEELRRRFEPA